MPETPRRHSFCAFVFLSVVSSIGFSGCCVLQQIGKGRQVFESESYL